MSQKPQILLVNKKALLRLTPPMSAFGLCVVSPFKTKLSMSSPPHIPTIILMAQPSQGEKKSLKSKVFFFLLDRLLSRRDGWCDYMLLSVSLFTRESMQAQH